MNFARTRSAATWLVIAALSAVLPVVLCAPAASAQSDPSAYKNRSSLWAGAGYTNFAASFPYGSGNRVAGLSAFVDYHWLPLLGIEGEAQWRSFGGFHGSTQSSYLAGPKYRFRRPDRIQPYAKFLVGSGNIHYPFQIGDASYFALAPGGGGTYRLTPNVTVRLDYEYQFWLNSPGISGQPQHALAPNGIQIGIAYRIHSF